MAAIDAAAVNLHDADVLASSLPTLLLAADRVASTIVYGVHGVRRAGTGDSFWQFRPYQTGDNTHRIDWRQSAKTGKIFLRETEWEAAQTVWFWRDGSPSMHYRSNAELPKKIERAGLLVLALMSMLGHSGERIGLLGKHMSPTTGRVGLRRMAVALEHESADEPSIPSVISVARHCRVVLVSDFLSPLADLNAFVRHLAGFGVQGHIVQILDPAEETLPFSGRTLFEGLEREGSTLVSRVEGIRRDYGAALAAQIEGLKAIARAVGWTIVTHRTDHSPQTALLSLYMALTEKPAV